jgi:hypothetical protein
MRTDPQDQPEQEQAVIGSTYGIRRDGNGLIPAEQRWQHRPNNKAVKPPASQTNCSCLRSKRRLDPAIFRIPIFPENGIHAD